MGVDYSYVTFQGDNTGLAARQLDVPAATLPYDANDPHARGRRSTPNTLPTYADIPVTHFSAYLQDDWQVGRGLTLQSRAALRRAVRRRSTRTSRSCWRSIAGEARARLRLSRSPVPFLDGSDRRGDRNNFGPRVGVAWDPCAERPDEHPRRLRHVLRQHAHAAELRRADVAAGQDRSSSHNPSFPDPLQGRSRDQFISTAPPNIAVFDNDTVNPYAHQVNVGRHADGRPTSSRVTADVTTVFRYSDRDTIDLNLPDQDDAACGRIRSSAASSFWQPTADNTYKALLVKVEKRMANRYQFSVSYTLSKADDTSFSNGYGDRLRLRRRSAMPADRRSPSSARGERHRAAAVRHAAVGDCSTCDRACRSSPTTQTEHEQRRLHGRSAGGRAAAAAAAARSDLDAVNRVRASRSLDGGHRARVSRLLESRLAAVEVLHGDVRPPRRADRAAVQIAIRTATPTSASAGQQSAEQPNFGQVNSHPAEHQRAVAPGGVRGPLSVLAAGQSSPHTPYHLQRGAHWRRYRRYIHGPRAAG